MYTFVIDQNWIRNFYRSIDYHKELPSKLYEENEATIKRVSEDRITTKYRPLDFLVTILHDIHLSKILDMVNTRSEMKIC